MVRQRHSRYIRMGNIEKEMRYRLYGIDQVIDFISVFFDFAETNLNLFYFICMK